MATNIGPNYKPEQSDYFRCRAPELEPNCAWTSLSASFENLAGRDNVDSKLQVCVTTIDPAAKKTCFDNALAALTATTVTNGPLLSRYITCRTPCGNWFLPAKQVDSA